MTTITRLGYCKKCFKEGRPKIDQNFIVFGKTSNIYRGLISEKSNKRGYVPHIYKLKFTKGNVVYYKRICCMDKCGTYIAKENGRNYICLDEAKWIHGATTVSNWNALVMYRDEAFVI